MLFKKWDLTKKIRLYINNIEMDFTGDFTASDHPTNFSSMVFHNVLPKSKNNYPENLIVQNFAEEFSIGEVYSDSELIFFGIVNSTGRLNLNPNIPKTKTIEISDFRKWLSIKKPVELLFFNEKPENIVVKLISGMAEPKIIVGKLDFSTNELIGAYSTFNKSPYQVLKEVIAKQTNSLLYFQINENKQITINYKSNKTLSTEINPLIVDLNNLDLLKKYKILDIEFESNVDKYSNVVKVESENVISNIKTKEELNILGDKVLTLGSIVGKISNNINDTFIFSKSDPSKKINLIIIDNDTYLDGQYFDILYTLGKNTITVNTKFINLDYVLRITYFVKKRTVLELSSSDEITKIANLSETNGEVFRFEKLNDLTNFNDLLKAVKTNLEIYKSIEKTIYIKSEIPLFEIINVVSVVSGKNDSVSGLYLVHEILAEVEGSNLNGSEKNNFILPVFTTILKSTKNTDNIVNEFDNQSFRDGAVVEQNKTLNTTESIPLNCVINLNTEMKESIVTQFENVTFNSSKLNYKIWGNRWDTTGVVLDVDNE